MPRFGRVVWGQAGLIVVALLVIWGGGRPTVVHAARNGTPVASPAASPAPLTYDCTAVLGTGQAGDACVTIIQASPNAPAVDVAIDGNKALENLAFGTASGSIALPAGGHRLHVTAAKPAADQTVLDVQRLDLQAGRAYEIALTGPLTTIAATVFPIDLSAVGADMARVRVIQAAPDAGAVDVAVTGGAPLISDLAFPRASDALTIPAGTYNLDLRAAGSDTVLLPLPDQQFAPGTVTSLYLIGSAAAHTLTVLPIVVPATS